MKHLGDITQINGAEIEPVDVVIGGSPCQDLSLAGKRAGLDGDRSSLFTEQIRIIREMREKDGENGRTGYMVRPRYMVWENVPGAFSSHKGEDFRRVLEETARIADENAVIPKPPKGKWRKSGCIMGDGWSIAWRVLDAQFWGVPQRRSRIALVADFGGGSAPEILFVRRGLQRDSEESGEAKEAFAKAAGTGAAGTDECAGFSGNQSGTSRGIGWQEETAPVLRGDAGGNMVPMVMATGQGHAEIMTNMAPTLNCNHEQPIVMADDRRNAEISTGLAPTIKSCNCGFAEIRGAVRRLTPLECERLQGYPDGWTEIGTWRDGKGRNRKTSDSLRYKALGNSIALPPWKWVLKRTSAQYERDATLGSLFDGIGGFPYLWEQINGKGTALWASEIDDFAIAVTKARIGANQP